MGSRKATVQTGVPQGAIASTVAGKLIEHARDLAGNRVNPRLPRQTQSCGLQLRSCKDRGQYMMRRRGLRVVGRNVIYRHSPLRRGAQCEQCDG